MPQEDEESTGHARNYHAPEHAANKHDRRTAPEPMPATDAAAGMSVSGGQARGMTVPSDKPHHKVWRWIVAHKKVSTPVAIALVLLVVAAIPFTRYAVAGLFIKRDLSVLVTDSRTGKPVTSATVTFRGVTALSNNKGAAIVHAPVGNGTVTVAKKYYATAAERALAPIGTQKKPVQISLVATGRQVPVTVVNKITGKPVAYIKIAAQGTEAKTDAKGQAVLVVPAQKDIVDAVLSGSGYVTAKAAVKVTGSEDPANAFTVTPSGKIYFLSNKNGTIDVVKTNLDGTDRQTVLTGTGSEDKYDTVLLASQDWRYLALLSKRDGGANAKLFLINTNNDAVTTMDEGQASFQIVGWSGHSFIYLVDRADVQSWQASQHALKAYDADSAKIATLDQTAAGGDSSSYFSESYAGVYILGDKVVYAKNVYASSVPAINGHAASMSTVKPNGSSKQAVKEWSFNATQPYYYAPVNITVGTRPYEVASLYVAESVSFVGSPDNSLYEYEDGKVTTVSGKTASNLYDNDYVTYLLSPSNTKTFWSESRDGSNTLFVGDANAKNPQAVVSEGDYQTYGWYTDSYLLLSKNGSELYIMPVNGGTPIKISDYYRPGVSFTGYGKGYGGL